MGSNVIAAARRFEYVTVRLVEDEDGTRLMLPDGRCIAGVAEAGIAVRPNELTVLSVRLTKFDVDLAAPRRRIERNGDS